MNMIRQFKSLIPFIAFAYTCATGVASTDTRALSKDTTEDTVWINSLDNLAKYVARDDVTIRMMPGTYILENTSTAQELDLVRYQNGKAVGDYPVASLINFSGNNSHYDLTHVTILIDSQLHQAFGGRHLFEIFVSGNNNVIEGLTVKDVGDTAPHRGAIMMHVMGDDNTISNADLFIHGSYPYGYGHLLGKGGNSLVQLRKHSSLLVSGRNTKLLNCKVTTHAFGHGIVMQGAVNTLIQGCTVIGEMRSTDAMLAETSGPAHNVDFRSDYPPGKIVPGEMKALAEDGIRSYRWGPAVGRRTDTITIIDSTIINMRSGIDLGASSGPTRVTGCTTIGCQEKGYSIPSGAVIEKSRGDAMYGPLISFPGRSTKDCRVELELLPTTSDYPPSRLAELNGSGHIIELRSHQKKIREDSAPIVFGESFWADVHQFRDPERSMDSLAFANNIQLINTTGMPVILTERTSDNQITSNGRILQDDGTNNVAKTLP